MFIFGGNGTLVVGAIVAYIIINKVMNDDEMETKKFIFTHRLQDL